MADISRITLPNGQTYDIKDSVARSAISQGISFHIATDAASTPEGVTWDNGGTVITGKLVASENTTGFYLVPAKNASGKDIYSEYVAVDNSGYSWERLGDTDFSIEEIIGLIDVVLTLTKDSVLGANTTFTAQSSAVTFTGGTNDTFVKSYPGSTQKLATTSIKGVGADTTFNAVNANTSVTATNTVFGTDTTASKVVTTSKTATNTVIGEPTSASKATAGTAFPVAKAAGLATNLTRVNYGTAGEGGAYSSSHPEVINTAYVENGSETLVITAVTATQGSVTGTNGTETITPYTFADVTVPVVTSNDSVTFNAVSSATDVTVPVVTSNNEVTATNTTTTSVTAATSAANATVVATGKVAAADANGDSVLIGLGTATTASAVTGIGTGTAAAQTITAGTNDLVDAVVNATATIVAR